MGAVRDMVQQAIDELGGLHSVINPAGILRDGMFHKMPDEDWDVSSSPSTCAVPTTSQPQATIEHFRNQEREGSYVLFYLDLRP